MKTGEDWASVSCTAQGWQALREYASDHQQSMPVYMQVVPDGVYCMVAGHLKEPVLQSVCRHAAIEMMTEGCQHTGVQAGAQSYVY